MSARGPAVSHGRGDAASPLRKRTLEDDESDDGRERKRMCTCGSSTGAEESDGDEDDEECREEDDGDSSDDANNNDTGGDEASFLEACARGHAGRVHRLLEAGSVDVNARYPAGDVKGWTVLTYAAHEGHEEVVELLLDHGANVNASNLRDGRTALHVAFSPTIVQLLLDYGGDPNVADNGFGTPLHAGVLQKRSEIVAMLLKYGATVNAVGTRTDGLAPIHILLYETSGNRGRAVAIPEYHDIAQSLVSHGATWDDKCDEAIDEGGVISLGFRVAVLFWMDEHRRRVDKLTTIPEEVFQRGPSSVEQYIAALHASKKIVLRRKICVVGPSFWGKTTLVKSISIGTPSLEDPDNRTIGIDQFPLKFTEEASDDDRLMAACRVGNIEAVRWLVDTKRVDLRSTPIGVGDENERNEFQGHTPLHYAVQHRHREIGQILLDNGVNLDIKSKRGNTPLALAVLAEEPRLIEALLVAGADPNPTDLEGHSPLFWALRNKFPEGAQLLLRNCAEVNIANEDGDTPLHCCVESPGMAPALLQAGANVHAKNKWGETPFHDIVNELVSKFPSEIERGELPSLLQAAQAMVFYGATWDAHCQSIVHDEGAAAQALHEAVLVWMEEREQGTELTPFPVDMYAQGPSRIRQFVAATKRSKEQHHQRAVHDTTSLEPSVPVARPLQQSSTARRQLRDENHSHNESLASTPGSFCDIVVNVEAPPFIEELNVDRHHEVTFWDFAGQEAYQVAHSAYFSKRTLYLVCVDLRAYAVALEQAELRADKDSDLELLMNEFVEAKIERWIGLVLASQPDAEFVFVGTKADILVRKADRVSKAYEDLQKRMKTYSVTIEKQSRDSDKRLERLQLRGASSSSQRTEDVLSSRALNASAKRLRQIEWLTVNCMDQQSVAAARTAIEQVIIKSKRSFQMPDLYSTVLQAISRHRTQVAAKGPSNQVKETFWDIGDLSLYLEVNVPELRDAACHAILRTLHDIGDVLWLEDLGIDYLKDRVILHPLVLIEFVREIVHHNHNTDVVTHAALKERPYWNDLDPERMLMMKQLLQQFHLVHPTGATMKWDSGLIVPAFWRSRECAAWLFAGDLLTNEPSLETIPKDFYVRWEYQFTTALPDMIFDALVIESYGSQYKRQAGPDWILYTVKDQFACRVVRTRASRTLTRVLRVEAIASKAAERTVWGRFEHLCESLERVLRRYKGLVVNRVIVNDEFEELNLDEFLDEWTKIPLDRREHKCWVPPHLEWYSKLKNPSDDTQVPTASA